MKNRKLLFLAFVLLTAIALYIQGDKTLSLNDQELDTVVGGLDCHYCGSNGDGCEPSWKTGNCDYETDGECDGNKQDSCKEAQQVCKEGGIGTCTNDSANCSGKYHTYTCKEDTSEQGGQTVIECYWKKDQENPFNCSGSRSDC